MLPKVAKTLDWLIRHEPAAAGCVIAEVVGEAEQELRIPRPVSEKSITTALALDGTLDEQTRKDFLTRILPPREQRHLICDRVSPDGGHPARWPDLGLPGPGPHRVYASVRPAYFPQPPCARRSAATSLTVFVR